MRWTKDYPEKPGYYWFRGEYTLPPRLNKSRKIVAVIEISEEANFGGLLRLKIVGAGGSLAPKTFIGEWYGPIDVPT